MSTPTSTKAKDWLTEIAEFTQVLHQHGVHAALGYLNRRTTHRYTGIFRFDGPHSCNEVLFDRYDATVRQGQDVPLAEAFCSLVGQEQAPVQIIDAALDPRAQAVNTLVVSYCGVLIRNRQGGVYGTLCHYDLELCQEIAVDLPLLEAAAPLFYAQLYPMPVTRTPLARVLLIEDDATAAFLQRRLLRRLGVTQQIVVAETGAQALSLLSPAAAAAPDLIFFSIRWLQPAQIAFLATYQELPLPRPPLVLLTLPGLRGPEWSWLLQLPTVGIFDHPLTEQKVAQILRVLHPDQSAWPTAYLP